MQPRYGLWLRGLLSLLFRHVGFPAKQVEQLAALREQGVVVYVTRGHSVWLSLCFNYLMQRFALPLPAFVGGVNFFWLQPVGRLWAALRQRHLPLPGPWDQAAPVSQPLSRHEKLLVLHVGRGLPAYIALPFPRDSGAAPPDLNDYIRALIVAQRLSPKRLFLVPHVLVDRTQSGTAHPSIVDRLFGDRRRPGALRHVIMLLTLRHGTVRSAAPLDLQAFLKERQASGAALDDGALAREVRAVLQHRMSEEERVVAGPRLSMVEATARRVLGDPLVRDAIVRENCRTQKSDIALEAAAQAHLRGIAARYDVRFLSVMSTLLNLVFHRIYDGIAVDEEGLQRAIEASRQGPLVFCPAHRSHIDYLVLSFVLWQHRIAPPHIAAGANLSFFPLGRLFRGCGAFFLRRSFGSDALYAAVFRAYIQELVRSGTAIEFFLEGTRSRTGKLLMPRFGLLSMLVQAWRSGAREDLQFVPLSIDYERIIEASSYERELQGAQKVTENIGGLLRTTKVLRSRYGRVQVQFGAPVSLRSLAAAAGLPQSLDAQNDPGFRALVQRLGYRILHQVAMVCSVTPTAVVCTALLAHAGRGMAQNILLERCADICTFLAGANARLSPSLHSPDTRVSAVLEAVQKLVDERLLVIDRAGRSDMEPIYRVPDSSRILLDYHKNALMNYFAPAALVARAVGRQKSGPVLHADVCEGTRFLSQLLRHEFVFRADSDFLTYFNETLTSLADRGFLEVLPQGQLNILRPQAVAHLGNLIDAFIQGYYITAKTLLDLRAFPLWDKELASRSLERVRRAFLEGEISRPEAANRTLIETALQWMTHAKVIEARRSGRRTTLHLCDAYGPDKLQQLIDTLASYL
jgi:glycerol-3-phosphate O-acyltransferase